MCPNWLLEMATTKVKPLLKKLMVHNASFSDVLLGLSKLFHKIENDLSLRQSLEKIPGLPLFPDPSTVTQAESCSFGENRRRLVGKATLSGETGKRACLTRPSDVELFRATTARQGQRKRSGQGCWKRKRSTISANHPTATFGTTEIPSLHCLQVVRSKRALR